VGDGSNRPSTEGCGEYHHDIVRTNRVFNVNTFSTILVDKRPVYSVDGDARFANFSGLNPFVLCDSSHGTAKHLLGRFSLGHRLGGSLALPALRRVLVICGYGHSSTSAP
jgi:hypothetical protein